MTNSHETGCHYRLFGPTAICTCYLESNLRTQREVLKVMPENIIEVIMKQCFDDSQRWFPDTAEDASYLAMCTAGEAGEMLNIAKKVYRGSIGWDTDITKEGKTQSAEEWFVEEGIDTFIFLMNIFELFGIDVVAEYQKKQAFNEERFGSRGERSNA